MRYEHVECEVNGHHVAVVCYGEVCDDSNFEVVCDNEELDSCWANGNPDSEEFTFSTWKEVVTKLSPYFNYEIVEITAC